MGHRNPSVLRWHTSSHSEDDDCVEVAVSGTAVLVRDSWNRREGHVVFSRPQWQAFLDVLGAPGARRRAGGGGAE